MSKKRDVIENQHYVPKLYLRNFCKHKEQIAVYIKSSSNSFFTNINNVANENYFYDNEELDTITQKVQFLEKYFHPIENKMKEIFVELFKQLDSGKFDGFKDEERFNISRFIIYQYMRTKEQREIFGQLNKELLKCFSNEFSLNSNVSEGNHIDDFSEKALHISLLLNEELMHKLTLSVYKKLWIILENNTTSPFITSDQPVVKHGNLGNEFRSMSGFNSKGVEISFPISPKYLLTITDEEFAYEKYLTYLDDTKVQANEQNVLFYNFLQITHSYNQLYSNINSFDLAKEILYERPELKEPNHVRINHTISK